jgi:hypothetical protein
LFFYIPKKNRFFEKSGTIADRKPFSSPAKIPAEKLCYALARHASAIACCGRDRAEPGRVTAQKESALFCRFLQ